MTISRALCFLLLLPLGCLAQRSEGGLWLGVEGEKDILKDLEFQGEMQLRLDRDMTRYATLLADVGVRYELLKDLDLDLTYRFAHGQNGEDLYFLRHRVNVDLRYTWDFGKPEVQFRLRYQTGQRGAVGGSEWIIDLENGLRYRIGGERKVFRKTKGNLDLELFQSQEDEGFLLSDWRLRFRLDRNLPGPHTLSLGYLFQEEIFEADPLREHILTLGYSVKF